MINLYASTESDFSSNGQATLEPIECTFSAVINGVWQLEMTLPYDSAGKYNLLANDKILRVTDLNAIQEQSQTQYFRIYDVKKEDDLVYVLAYPVGLDARFDTYIDNLKCYDMTGIAAASAINEISNKYIVTSDVSKVASGEWDNVNLIAILNGEEGFVQKWGGEICYDNYQIKMLSRLGRTSGTTDVRYGKNITGMSYELDASNVVTRIYPVASDTDEDGKYKYALNTDSRYAIANVPYVDSTHINDYPLPHIFFVETPYKLVQLSDDGSQEYILSLVRYNKIEADTANVWTRIIMQDTHMINDNEIELEYFVKNLNYTQINDGIQGIVEYIWRKMINNGTTNITTGDIQSLIYNAIKDGFSEVFSDQTSQYYIGGYRRSWKTLNSRKMYTYDWDSTGDYAVKEAWIKDGSNWVWVDEYGEQSGVTDNGKWKWYKVKGKSYKRYGNKKKGRYLKNQWYQINDTWYHFNSDGKGIKSSTLRTYAYNIINGYINDYYRPQVLTYMIETEQVLLELLYTQMTAYCNDLYNNDGIDLPVVNMEIDMVDLSKTIQYAGYEDLLNIRLGDNVRCINPKIGISTTERIVGLTYDVLRGFNSSIRIGLTQSSIVNMLTSIGQSEDHVLIAGENVVIENDRINVILPKSLKDVVVNGESVVDGDTAYIDLEEMGIDETIDVIYGTEDPDPDEGEDKDFYLKIEERTEDILSEDNFEVVEEVSYPIALSSFTKKSRNEFDFMITGIPSDHDAGEHAWFVLDGLVEGHTYHLSFNMKFNDGASFHARGHDRFKICGETITFITDLQTNSYSADFTYAADGKAEFMFYGLTDGVEFTATITNFIITGDFTDDGIEDLYNKYEGKWLKYSRSDVKITPTLTEGEKIADYEINGVAGELYAPTGGGGSGGSDFDFVYNETDGGIDIVYPSQGGGGGATIKYSTEEQVIGTWIDGKPLYQKSYAFTNTQSSFSDYVTLYNIPNIDNVIKNSFTALRDLGNNAKLHYTGEGVVHPEQDNNYWIGVREYNGNIQYYINNYGTQITDMIITTQYTKTTD